jgi:FkbM family methyltransferase
MERTTEVDMSEIITNGWIMNKYFTSGAEIIDAGANIGGYTTVFANHIGPEGMVYAFEPAPVAYAELYEKTKDLPNVRIFKLGLSDVPHVVKGMSIYNAWTLQRVGQTTLDKVPGHDTFDVEFTTIDKFVADNEVRPALMKIDVDGYELRALMGAEVQLLHRVPMFLEISYLVKFVGDTIEDFVDFIYDHGYWVFPVYKDHDLDVLKTAKQLLDQFPHNTSWDACVVHRDDPVLQRLGRDIT